MRVLLVTSAAGYGALCSEYWSSLARLDPGKNVLDVMILTEDPYPGEWDRNIGHKLNRARTYAISQGYDYLWIIESDIVVPSQALPMLLELKADVACGLTPERPTKVGTDRFIVEMSWNGNPGAREAIPKGQSFRIPGVGSYTCTLVARRLFEAEVFPEQLAGDMAWYWKIQKAGFVVMVHPGVLCGHVDRDGRVIRSEDYCLGYWRGMIARAEVERKPWYYYVPCPQDNPWWYGLDQLRFLEKLPEHMKTELIWWLF